MRGGGNEAAEWRTSDSRATPPPFSFDTPEGRYIRQSQGQLKQDLYQGSNSLLGGCRLSALEVRSVARGPVGGSSSSVGEAEGRVMGANERSNVGDGADAAAPSNVADTSRKGTAERTSPPSPQPLVILNQPGAVLVCVCQTDDNRQDAGGASGGDDDIDDERAYDGDETPVEEDQSCVESATDADATDQEAAEDSDGDGMNSNVKGNGERNNLHGRKGGAESRDAKPRASVNVARQDQIRLIKELPMRFRPTAHAINEAASPERVIVSVGTERGEVFVWDAAPEAKVSPILLNKDGGCDMGRVVDVQWEPRAEAPLTSPGKFLVVHDNGFMYSYNVNVGEKVSEFASPAAAAVRRHDMVRVEEARPSGTNNSKPTNPTHRWTIGHVGVWSVRYSPRKGGKMLATVGADGYLRIIDRASCKLIVAFKSYFGGLHCVCWTPDERYVLAGGEDDMVTIWDWRGRAAVARLVGHQSWVASVAVDPHVAVAGVLDGDDDTDDDELSGEKKGGMRIVSGGHDAKLILWDFSLENLLPRKAEPEPADPDAKLLRAPTRAAVSILPPLVVVDCHKEPVTGLAFTASHMYTASVQDVQLWSRPKDDSNIGNTVEALGAAMGAM